MKKILIIGNPNCGKTTLYNVLTGSRRSTGNRAGVTVDAATSELKHGKEKLVFTDLPGTYSLTPYTYEEKTVKEHLDAGGYDVILNVVDSTNAVRNLKLTTELAQYRTPVVIAFNLADKVDYKIDTHGISTVLGGTAVAVSAITGKGLKELLDAICYTTSPLMQRAEYGDIPKTYGMLTELCGKYIGTENGNRKLTEKVEYFTTNKYTAFPILLCVLAVVFYLSFSGPVKLISDFTDMLISENLYNLVRTLLLTHGGNEMFCGLICDGLIRGAGSVISYVPQIAVLTTLMSVIEDSGYLSRAAFLTDRIFSEIGISGKCFICLTLGFGCSVPAIMSTRVLESRGDKILSVLLIPFLPCSAKLPLFVMLSELLFDGSVIFILSLYLLGAAAGVLYIKLLSRGIKSNGDFFLELPSYRVPALKSVTVSVYIRVRDFLLKAGTVIAICSVSVWLLKSFTPDLSYTQVPEESIMGFVGEKLLFILKPIGVTQGEQAIALFSGLFAREAIVSSLEILYNNSQTVISEVFSRASAYAYCAFSLLLVPCSATVITAARELKSAKLMLLMISFHFVIAYAVSAALFAVLKHIFIY